MIFCFLILLNLFSGGCSVNSSNDVECFEHYKFSNADSALFFINRAIDRAKSKGDQLATADLLQKKGTFLKNIGDFQNSLEAHSQSLDLLSQLGDSLKIANSLTDIGITYWRSGDGESALEHYIKSISISRRLNNAAGLARTHIALGNYFAEEEQFEKALENYRDAGKYLNNEQVQLKALIFKNSGNIYATHAFKRLNLDSALLLYEASKEMYLKIGDSINIAGLYLNEGLIFEQRKNYEQALVQYKAALEVQSRLGLKRDMIETHNNIGNVYVRLGLYPAAKDAYNSAYETLLFVSDSHRLHHVLGNLAMVSAKLNDYGAAYRFLNLADSIGKIIYDSTSIEKVKELETKYDTEKKQAEIRLRTSQRDAVMIVLIIAIALTIVIIVIYSQRQRVTFKLREKEKALMDGKIDELLREQEITSLRAYLSGQDEERKRLAEDLHDRLGSTLSATKLYFASARNHANADDSGLKKANELLDVAVQEVREISHNLLSGTIAKLGLITALQELIETIRQSSGIDIQLIQHGNIGRLESKLEQQLYRIVQEALSNVLKHSEAKEVILQLNKHDEELVLIIEDFGKGFDAKRQRTEGIGLRNIESRVQSVKGDLIIDSTPGKGTTLTVTIPMQS